MRSDEKINKLVLKDMNDLHAMDRRDFMKRFGGGLVIAFAVSDLRAIAGLSPAKAKESDVNAYLRIGEDGRVTLYTGKVELGQGPITSLPMELADELDVSLDRVDIIMGDTDICPWDNGTYGSLTTREFGPLLRAAAAEARAMLLEMAASKLSTTVENLSVSDGVISLKSDDTKQITYQELTQGKAIFETIHRNSPIKKASEFKIMGTPRLHVDGELKVTGKAKYAGDIQLPGMMYGRILRPPSLGAKLISVDLSAAEAMEGVEVVRDEDFIGVLHKSQDMADRALTLIKAEYEKDSSQLDHENIYEYLVKQGTKSRNVGSKGDLTTGEQQSATLIESEYHDPYIAHAPMEPHTATAVFEGEKLKIWASCQTPYPTKVDVAKALGMPEENVRLMQIFTGGGFGGKIYNPQAIEAARLAKLSGKPIQLVWSRKEEFMYDRCRPAATIKIKSGITKEGMISLWDYSIYFGGRRGAKPFYELPNHLVQNLSEGIGAEGHPYFTGAWRAPSNNTNTFARESEMDVLAAAAGVDPLEFRLRHLIKDKKMAEVLKAGAERFGWTAGKGEGGRGIGLACGIDAGTYVAVFVEIDLNKDNGHIQVKRAVVSQNMGMVVNPQGVIIQAEGCVIMGLGYSLSEEIIFKGKTMLTRNFDTYELPRFSWTPEIEVVLIDAQDDPPQGGGEPAIICMGGAIANAIFNASGARLYKLPLNPESVLQAIQNL